MEGNHLRAKEIFSCWEGRWYNNTVLACNLKINLNTERANQTVKLTVVGVHDVAGPLLGGRVQEAGLVQLRPDDTLSVEARSRGRCFGNVDENGSLVATRNSILPSALRVLVPFKAAKSSIECYCMNFTVRT